jgi:phenylpropionate dioxygenase-like ring-hydroxylating dioxygenase large terminal subunit
MRAPVRVLGSYSQMLASNWKLYMENVKDSYHASLLHTFFTTFRLNRLTQKRAGHQQAAAITSAIRLPPTPAAANTSRQACAPRRGFGLKRRKWCNVDEYGDGIGLQILSVFPTFVLQQTATASRCGVVTRPRRPS